jgi:hypothetical protein
MSRGRRRPLIVEFAKSQSMTVTRRRSPSSSSEGFVDETWGAGSISAEMLRTSALGLGADRRAPHDVQNAAPSERASPQ